MVPFNDLILFALAALAMVVTPGPNMIYLISRSISQGKNAGMISLFGVLCGFIFHILMASLGLTLIFKSVPNAFLLVKIIGVGYLIYLAYNSVVSKNEFAQAKPGLKKASGLKLFSIGFLTNVLNPKMAVFYLSFFSQFIKPEYGSLLTQGFQLGLVQILISLIVNSIIVISASKAAGVLSAKPRWQRIQKWFMASVFTGLAAKLAVTKLK